MTEDIEILDFPKDWKDLQNKVAEILEQCGFNVSVEHNVQSARSSIEIDVYAEEWVDNRKYLILCECKMWKSNIPQLYVHGLRTVAGDIGANKGYIITTSNFQRAAIQSVLSTNIELLTWKEFQNTFFKSWYKNYFLTELNTLLASDYDPTLIQFFDNFTKISKKEFRELIEKYNFIQSISEHFLDHFYDYFLGFGIHKTIDKKLPLKDKLELNKWEYFVKIPKEIMGENNYSNFLKQISNYSTPIYQKMDSLDLKMKYDD